MNDADFSRRARRVLLAWLALLALMFASLGSAYLSLGALNAVAGIVIAVLKSAIVIGFFMGLVRASGMVRLVAATALAAWLLLISLAGVDYATRPDEPAPMQTPRQLDSVSSSTNRAGRDHRLPSQLRAAPRTTFAGRQRRGRMQLGFFDTCPSAASAQLAHTGLSAALWH